MSFQAMSWAVDKKCESAGQKLTLLMLANYCNGHTGQCNPSHKRLAEECSMGVSTLKRNIAGLEAAGFLTIVHKSLDGVSLPNQYMLKLDGVSPNWTEGRPKLDGGVGPNRATNQEFEPGIEPVSVARLRLPTCPTQSIVNLYHEVLPELPAVRLLSAKRKKTISDFWKFVLTGKRSDGTVRATDAESAIAWVRIYFERARNNDFLMGRGKKADGHEGWTCDIDFLLSERGQVHVIEKTKDTA